MRGSLSIIILFGLLNSCLKANRDQSHHSLKSENPGGVLAFVSPQAACEKYPAVGQGVSVAENEFIKFMFALLSAPPSDGYRPEIIESLALSKTLNQDIPYWDTFKVNASMTTTKTFLMDIIQNLRANGVLDETASKTYKFVCNTSVDELNSALNHNMELAREEEASLNRELSAGEKELALELIDAIAADSAACKNGKFMGKLQKILVNRIGYSREARLRNLYTMLVGRKTYNGEDFTEDMIKTWGHSTPIEGSSSTFVFELMMYWNSRGMCDTAVLYSLQYLTDTVPN